MHNVGGIKSTAEAGLQHLKVDLFVLEVNEGQSGEYFKGGQLTVNAKLVEIIKTGPELLNQGGEFGFRDGLPVDLDPLREAVEVRRSV